MNLNIQISTFIFSLFFGIYFGLILDILKKLLTSKSELIKIVSSFIVVFLNSILYFIIILNLNSAILHPYYLIAFIVGNLVYFVIFNLIKRIVKKHKK